MNISKTIRENKTHLSNWLWYTLVFLHIALIPIFLGIWTTIPSFLQIFSNWIHLVVGLYLVVRFHPFQSKTELYSHDLKLVFSAGLFMLEALFASVILTTIWGKQFVTYITKKMEWLKRLPFVAPFVEKTKFSETFSKDTTPEPNASSTSLGGSAYLLAMK
jgi:hypothetical protein